jgi:hypothetical protein
VSLKGYRIPKKNILSRLGDKRSPSPVLPGEVDDTNAVRDEPAETQSELSPSTPTKDTASLVPDILLDHVDEELEEMTSPTTQVTPVVYTARHIPPGAPGMRRWSTTFQSLPVVENLAVTRRDMDAGEERACALWYGDTLEQHALKKERKIARLERKLKKARRVAEGIRNMAAVCHHKLYN